MNLPSIESITFDECVHSNGDNVFRLGEGTANIPNLKSYLEKLIFTWRDRQKMESDSHIVKKFCASSVAAKMEGFELADFELGDDGLRELVQNASNMKCLKVLKLGSAALKHTIEMITEAGALGGWPVLEKLGPQFLLVDPEQADLGRRRGLPAGWLQLCEALLHPIWPDLELSLSSYIVTN